MSKALSPAIQARTDTERLHICTSRFFGSFVVVRLGSFDDFPFLSDQKLRIFFYRKQRRELAGCDGNFLSFARFIGQIP
ncbi:hypothetical protein M5K25_008259 [Dendrobium thyrsiflorum]|uniref:Uncharacterized protein n=1 Tax=Dendrobium thyrsiflorum TaxID=117978 RepID=A0ABD0VF09_DENTH